MATVQATFATSHCTYAAIAKMMARPVKFIADRLESFSSDIHARDHRITARETAVDAAHASRQQAAATPQP